MLPQHFLATSQESVRIVSDTIISKQNDPSVFGLHEGAGTFKDALGWSDDVELLLSLLNGYKRAVGHCAPQTLCDSTGVFKFIQMFPGHCANGPLSYQGT